MHLPCSFFQDPFLSLASMILSTDATSLYLCFSLSHGMGLLSHPLHLLILISLQNLSMLWCSSGSSLPWNLRLDYLLKLPNQLVSHIFFLESWAPLAQFFTIYSPWLAQGATLLLQPSQLDQHWTSHSGSLLSRTFQKDLDIDSHLGLLVRPETCTLRVLWAVIVLSRTKKHKASVYKGERECSQPAEQRYC